MVHALHLTTWHPWVQGMAGIFIPEQCAALDRAGIRTGLVFARIEGLRSFSLRRAHKGIPQFVRTDDPVPTFGFASWSPPGMGRFIPRVTDRAFSHGFRRYCESRGRPDILHAHVALQAGASTRRIAREAGLDYVVTEHSSDILNAKLSDESRALARQVYTDARCVIAVSRALASSIATIAPDARVRVIGNMVPDFVFGLRRAERPPSDVIRLVTLSNLGPGKRVHNAIAAIGALPAPLRARIVLDVIGGGPERPRLEALAKEAGVAARFHGELYRDEAMALLSQADLLVHASAFETFGIVVAEAGAMGVPVVATRCGGPEDIVLPETGVLVDVDDVAGLRDAIASVLDNLGDWCARRDLTVRKTFERFHESRVAAAIGEVYR